MITPPLRPYMLHLLAKFPGDAWLVTRISLHNLTGAIATGFFAVLAGQN